MNGQAPPAPQFGASYGMNNQVRDGGDNYLLRPESGLRLLFPNWDSQTWFRPFACPDGNGGLKPWRFGPNEKDFTDWFAFLPPVVRLGGDIQRITYIDFDFAVGPSGVTPYTFIRQSARRQQKAGAFGWDILFKGGNNKGPAIPRPDNMVLLQGLCLLNGEEDYRQQPLYSTLLLSSSATDEFTNSLRQPGRDPNSQVLDEIFAFGDVTHPQTGSYLQIVGKNKSLLSRPVAQPPAATSRFASTDKKDREFQKYDVLWHQPYSVPADYMLAMFKPWNNLLRALSLQEQTEILCSAFSPWITRNAFMDTQFEPFVPPHTRTAWERNSGTVSMAGAAPYGQPPVQQGYGQPPMQQGYGQPPVQQGYPQPPVQHGYGAPPAAQPPLMAGMMSNVAPPQGYGPPPPSQAPAYGQQPLPQGYGHQQQQPPPGYPPQQQQPPAAPNPGYPTATAPANPGYPTAPPSVQYQQQAPPPVQYQPPVAPPPSMQYPQPMPPQQAPQQYQQPMPPQQGQPQYQQQGPTQYQQPMPPQQGPQQGQQYQPPVQPGAYQPPPSPGGMASPQSQQMATGVNSSLQKLQDLVRDVNSAPPNQGGAPMPPPGHPQQ